MNYCCRFRLSNYISQQRDRQEDAHKLFQGLENRIAANAASYPSSSITVIALDQVITSATRRVGAATSYEAALLISVLWSSYELPTIKRCISGKKPVHVQWTSISIGLDLNQNWAPNFDFKRELRRKKNSGQSKSGRFKSHKIGFSDQNQNRPDFGFRFSWILIP